MLLKSTLFISLFLLNSVSIFAETTFVDFLSDSIKHSEAGTALNISGDKLGVFYVPIRTLDFPFPNSFDAAIGATAGNGSAEGLASIRVNMPQIANGIFGTSWFLKNSHGRELPTLFIGPAFKTHWPINKWRWDSDFLVLIGIPIGSLGL